MGLELSIEPGRVTDAKALSAIAQSTFELACPVDSDKSEIAKYIAENLSEPQFKQMLLVEVANAMFIHSVDLIDLLPYDQWNITAFMRQFGRCC